MQAEKELIETAYDKIFAFSKNISSPDIELSDQDIKYIRHIIRNIVSETSIILFNIDHIVLKQENNHNEKKEIDNEKNNLYNNTNITD